MLDLSDLALYVHLFSKAVKVNLVKNQKFFGVLKPQTFNRGAFTFSGLLWHPAIYVQKSVARVSSAGIALAKGKKQLQRQIAQIMILQPRNHDTTAQNEWGARNS